MKILHICAGWEETNGAAVIARLVAEEQRRNGHEIAFGTQASVKEIREADEVWTHCGWLPVLWRAGFFARRLVRMPEACYDPVRLDYHGWKKKLVGPVERFFLRRADKVVATCDAEKEWILSYEPKAKVDVVDIKRYFRLVGGDQNQVKVKVKVRDEGEQRAVRLLYLGRRHPLKGVEFLERAVEELKRNPQFASRLRLRIVSDAVGEEKEKVWDWCDVLVLPTLTENFGLVIAEALERGKRVITTDGAPAWTPSGAEQGIPSAFGGRLVYLGGYRAGNAATRIQLLKTAISALFAER